MAAPAATGLAGYNLRTSIGPIGDIGIGGVGSWRSFGDYGAGGAADDLVALVRTRLPTPPSLHLDRRQTVDVRIGTQWHPAAEVLVERRDDEYRRQRRRVEQ